jgi:hypothetical protein
MSQYSGRYKTQDFYNAIEIICSLSKDDQVRFVPRLNQMLKDGAEANDFMVQVGMQEYEAISSLKHAIDQGAHTAILDLLIQNNRSPEELKKYMAYATTKGCKDIATSIDKGMTKALMAKLGVNDDTPPSYTESAEAAAFAGGAAAAVEINSVDASTMTELTMADLDLLLGVTQ